MCGCASHACRRPTLKPKSLHAAGNAVTEAGACGCRCLPPAAARQPGLQVRSETDLQHQGLRSSEIRDRNPPQNTFSFRRSRTAQVAQSQGQSHAGGRAAFGLLFACWRRHLQPTCFILRTAGGAVTGASACRRPCRLWAAAARQRGLQLHCLCANAARHDRRLVDRGARFLSCKIYLSR